MCGKSWGCLDNMAVHSKNSDKEPDNFVFHAGPPFREVDVCSGFVSKIDRVFSVRIERNKREWVRGCSGSPCYL